MTRVSRPQRRMRPLAAARACAQMLTPTAVHRRRCLLDAFFISRIHGFFERKRAHASVNSPARILERTCAHTQTRARARTHKRMTTKFANNNGDDDRRRRERRAPLRRHFASRAPIACESIRAARLCRCKSVCITSARATKHRRRRRRQVSYAQTFARNFPIFFFRVNDRQFELNLMRTLTFVNKPMYLADDLKRAEQRAIAFLLLFCRSLATTTPNRAIKSMKPRQLLPLFQGVVCSLHSEDDFGKLALVNDAPRAATIVMSEPDAEFLRVDRADFDRQVMQSRRARDRMRDAECRHEVMIKTRAQIARHSHANIDAQKAASRRLYTLH